MTLPNAHDWLLAVGAVAAVQAAALARFAALALGPARRPSPARPACVVVPVAGADGGLAARLRAVTAQPYAGPVSFLFVCPSERDPAWPVVSAAAASSPRPARAAASGRAPAPGRSGKVEDLLYALELVAPEAEVLVFADADVAVPPRWLESLAAAAEAGPATAAMLYAPRRPRPGSLARLAWTAYGLPFFAFSGDVTGQSWAVLARDFRRARVAEAWASAVYEDLAARAAFETAGLRARFVPEAVPVTPDACPSFAEAAAVFDRWMRAYRVLHPSVWLLGLGVTALKAGALAAACLPGGSPLPALALLGADALFLAGSAWLSSRAAPPPGRPGLPGPVWLWAALSVPLLHLMLLRNYAASLLSTTVRWGGRTYRLRRPEAPA